MSIADALRSYRSRLAEAVWGAKSTQSWRATILRRLSRPVVVVFTGAVAAATVLLLVSSLLSAVVQSWSRSDIQMRARIVHLTTKDQIEALLHDASLTAKLQLEGLFKRLISDERLEAVGICEPNGVMHGATQTMPARLLCSSLRLGKKETTTEISLGTQDLLVSAFPLKDGADGHLIIVHDLTYSRVRSEEARIYILIATIAAAALVGGAAAFAAYVLFRNWDAALRHAIDDLRAGRVDTPPHPPASLPGQLRQALDQYDLVRRTIDGVHIDWSPDTLKRALGAELPGVEIIVVSNR